MHKQLNIFSAGTAFIAVALLIGVAGCSQATDAGEQCADKACFTQHFAKCEAATYNTEKKAGGQARYQILGPVDSRCRVQMQYTTNPNSAWVDKPLRFVLDSKQAFEPQMQKALQACLLEDQPGDYQCSGPLRGKASAAGAAQGETQVVNQSAPAAGPAAAQLPAITDDAPTRFPIEKDGKWGYINRAGEMMIPPRFEAANDFYNGMAGVKIDGLFGYIDTDGKLVIQPQFDAVGAFSDGLAAVRGEGEQDLSFIDRDGKMVISAQFRNGHQLKSTRFVDGLAPAQETDPDPDSPYWYYGFADKQGQWKIKPQFREARSFSEGLAAVEKQNGKWVYIDTSGKVVLEGSWFDAGDFSDGLAAVNTKKGMGDGHWQYINKQGEIAVAPVFGTQRNSSPPSKAMRFSEGLGLVYFSGAKTWQYITADKFGNEAKFTTPEGIKGYEKAQPFRGGIAPVIPIRVRGGSTDTTVYIDRQGTRIWPPEDES